MHAVRSEVQEALHNGDVVVAKRPIQIDAANVESGTRGKLVLFGEVVEWDGGAINNLEDLELGTDFDKVKTAFSGRRSRRELKKLFDASLMTQDEFDDKKKKITQAVAEHAKNFRDLHSIEVDGIGEFEPFYSFAETPFLPAVKEVFAKSGYEAPTPIQALSWPIALQGRDLISIARTGSGKTCGFLLPAFDMVWKSRPPEEQNQEVVEDFVPIASDMIGRVIGKSGDTMKRIQSRSGCKLRLDQPDRDKDGRVMIKGRPAQVETAKGLIAQVTSQEWREEAGKGPSILVLAPTRELAMQITDEADKFADAAGMQKAVCLYGGESAGVQIGQVQLRPELVVATPGRCNDISDRMPFLADVEFLVLDEADRMLDMGFEPQIRSIIRQLPKDHQTLMFSATWPKSVQNLAQSYLKNPVQLNVGKRDVLAANKKIKQVIKITRDKDKEAELMKVLDEIRSKSSDVMHMGKTIVFMNRKADCDFISDQLWGMGYAADSLHGDFDQERRTNVVNAFKEGSINTLVATDVAARGLDVADVETVINFDFPKGDVESYVHRIGRTARGEADGLSVSFFSPKEDGAAAAPLIKVLQNSGQDVPEELREIAKEAGKRSAKKASSGRR
jgi:superfamily II DNA/RNA helicase